MNGKNTSQIIVGEADMAINRWQGNGERADGGRSHSAALQKVQCDCFVRGRRRCSDEEEEEDDGL